MKEGFIEIAKIGSTGEITWSGKDLASLVPEKKVDGFDNPVISDEHQIIKPKKPEITKVASISQNGSVSFDDPSVVNLIDIERGKQKGSVNEGKFGGGTILPDGKGFYMDEIKPGPEGIYHTIMEPIDLENQLHDGESTPRVIPDENVIFSRNNTTHNEEQIKEQKKSDAQFNLNLFTIHHTAKAYKEEARKWHNEYE